MNGREGIALEQTEAEDAFVKRVYRDFSENLWRQKLWIASYCAFVVLVCAIITIRQLSYYRATATLLIDANTVPDPAEQRSLGNLDLQAAIIQSPEVIDRVIEKANLSSDPVFSKNPDLKETFSEHLKVQIDQGNKTIQIHFLDTRPTVAALVANQTAKAYLYEKVEKSSGVSIESIESLKANLSQEMEKLNEVKTKLAELNKQNPDLGNEGVTGDQVKFLNAEYIRIDTNALQTKTTLSELEDMLKNGRSFESHPYFSSHPRVKEKLEQLRAAELDTLQLEQEYRGMHPLVLRAKTKQKALQEALDEEKVLVLEELRSTLKTEQTTLQKLRESIQALQAKDKELTPQKFDYKNLLAEEASITETINLLNTQISKASVASSFKQTGIEILSYAVVPDQPYSPNRLKNISIAFFFAIFSSIGFVFLACYFDRTFKTDEDIEQLLMKPFLGHLPFTRVSKGTLQPSFRDEKENVYFMNFLRLICANSSFLIAGKEKPTILITSAKPEEGKSFTAYHIANTFALEGKKVVLVDVDFCRSVLSVSFPDLEKRPGLHDYLMGDAEVEEIIAATGKPNFFFIQSLEAQFSAPHALRSDRMKDLIRKLKQDFDVVIFDTPPILVINDAVALGESVDMRILVVEWGKTPRETVQRALKKIAPSNLLLAGVVLNKAKHWGASYYYEHYYSGKKERLGAKKNNKVS